MARLSARGLTRRPFFVDRDLDVDAGEIVVVSGPSGSGKSLFLRALADLDPTDEGDVLLDGEARAGLDAATWRACVLYVHPGGVRLPGTVRANLDAIAALPLHRGQAPFPPVPGLDDLLDAERLSGGEAQALALHRALCCRPRVLLLDESTSAMDPALARAWEARVGAFATDGGAVVWISHDEALASRVATRRERFA